MSIKRTNIRKYQIISDKITNIGVYFQYPNIRLKSENIREKREHQKISCNLKEDARTSENVAEYCIILENIRKYRISDISEKSGNIR